VIVSGREGLAEDGVCVLLRTTDGDALLANYPRGNETRFEHLPAMTVYAQAIGHEGSRCSAIARVDLGVAQSHEIALQLVAGAEVEIAAGAFGDAVRHLDVDQPGHGVSRIGIRPGRRATFWLPLGESRVGWDGGARTLRVEPTVRNRWP
jgi:hypothetical protein